MAAQRILLATLWLAGLTGCAFTPPAPEANAACRDGAPDQDVGCDPHPDPEHDPRPSGAVDCAQDCTPSCDPSACNSVEPMHECGDGTLGGPEACDDGNVASGDGCSSACAVEPGWACLGTTCHRARSCGNSLIEDEEACDDGNTSSGDGCSAICTVEQGWACSGPHCSASCGDGLRVGPETCDDGNLTAGDGCSERCSVEDGWTCPLHAACRATCGDHIITGTEACDDGNRTAGDGCSPRCERESGWTCDARGCSRVCIGADVDVCMDLEEIFGANLSRLGVRFGAKPDEVNDAFGSVLILATGAAHEYDDVVAYMTGGLAGLLFPSPTFPAAPFPHLDSAHATFLFEDPPAPRVGGGGGGGDGGDDGDGDGSPVAFAEKVLFRLSIRYDANGAAAIDEFTSQHHIPRIGAGASERFRVEGPHLVISGGMDKPSCVVKNQPCIEIRAKNGLAFKNEPGPD